MSKWHISKAVVLLCGALAISACDDVLEGKDEPGYEHEDDGCCSGGGRPSRGGGSHPDEPDDPDDPDQPDDGEPPRVELRQGELIGRYESDEVLSFLGIPYAKPPVDELRFFLALAATGGLVYRARRYELRPQLHPVWG